MIRYSLERRPSKGKVVTVVRKKEKNFYADKVADNWINCEKSMLSTQYRLRLEFICKRIADGEEVKLDDMIWAEKLGKANRSAAEMLRKARRIASNPDMVPGSLDDFMNQMDIGDPDPSNHIVDGFNTVEEIAAWFKQDKTDDWRQRD